MRALGEETAKLVESEESAPIPEPPPFFGEPPVRDDIAEKAAEPALAAEPAETVPEEKNEEPAPEKDENPAASEEKTENDEARPAADIPEKITQEDWENAVAKCDFMTATMLQGSKAEIENGTLVIRSSNNMLVNNVKNEELDAFRAEISKALGFEIGVKIEKEAISDAEKENNQSEIDKLLGKARQLGIEIKQE